MKKKNNNHIKIINEYKRCVTNDGNKIAIELINDVFDIIPYIRQFATKAKAHFTFLLLHRQNFD